MEKLMSDEPDRLIDVEASAEEQDSPEETTTVDKDVETNTLVGSKESSPSEDQLEDVVDIVENSASPTLPEFEAPDAQVTVTSVIEALLFANDEPVTVNKLASIVELTGKQIHQAMEELNQKYDTGHHAFRIEKIAGGYQMLTLPSYESWLRKLVRVRGDSKLSPAALETLAIVAYKQPAIRADIEAIRGVASGEILRSLMVKGLVKIVGRAEVIGRPMQYGTTKKFLEVFGLDTLKDLPTIEQLKRPEETKPTANQNDSLPMHPLAGPLAPEMPPSPFLESDAGDSQ